jgi:hypothetical protein
MSKALSITKCVWTWLLLALFVLTCPGRIQAQRQTATVTGTATDSSGGALAGANIQATNVATAIALSTVTDSQGRYTIPALQVGTYDLQASLSGFQTVIHKGVILSVGGTLVVDFSLPVGQVSTTVSVEAQVSRVQTETSDVSTLVSPQQMRDLPLNGRNFEQLITLTPGVTTIAPAINFVTGRLYGMQDNYSVSGARPTGQQFLLDNTDIRDFWEHGTGSGYAGTSLGVEAIGEFRVLTNTYTAEYAGNGVVVNMVSRSGSNSFHGGVYEFYRDQALDARDINDPLSGPPPFNRNQFGAAIGGPIKKDKIFFFANYEGLRETLSETTFLDFPEPYIGNGELPCGTPGAVVAPLNNGAVNNFSVACAALTPAVGNMWPAVGTAGNPILPAVSAAPSEATLQTMNAERLMTLCAKCTAEAATATDLGGYFLGNVAPPLVTNENYTLDRVDYVIGPNDSAFARYVFDQANIADGPREPLGIFPENDYTRNQFLTITEKHIFSPTMVNSASFGFVRNNETSTVREQLTSAQIAAANLLPNPGQPSADPVDFVRTTFAGSAELPREDGQIEPLPSTAIGAEIGPDNNRPDYLIQNRYSGSEDLFVTHGPHSFKFGVVVTRVQTNNIQTAYANGTIYGAAPPTGNGLTIPITASSLQNYLDGNYTGSAVYAVPEGFNNSTRYFREIYVAPYIQDDWKVTPKLTINYGIRYDFDTNPKGWSAAYSVNGVKEVSLTTLVGSYTAPQGPATPSTSNYCPYTVCFPPTGNPASLFTPVRHVYQNNPNAANWGPRFGFAYDPFNDHKTAIRGGFGIFHDPVAPRTYESGFIATPPALSILQIAPGFPNFSTGLFQEPPGEFAGVDYIMPNGSPYIMQYNLNIQREVLRNTVLSVGYVGSVSRHLFMQRDDNIPKCDTWPNCTAIPSIDAPNTGAHFTNPLGFPFTAPRINQDYGSLVIEHNTIPANYNSLQVSLNRHFAQNLAGSINYTYSHCIDEGSFTSSLEEFAQLLIDSYNQKYDYGNCLFDIRNNFNANGLYTLPFTGNRFKEGWQFATILAIHNGTPVNIAYAFSPFDPNFLGSEWGSRPNYSGAAGCKPNQLIDKYSTTAPPGPGFGPTTVVTWFNSQCYAPQESGYFGNVTRNSVPGPGAVSWDFSLIKNTKITEGTNLQLRVETFNIINHFNPGMPIEDMGTCVPGPAGTPCVATSLLGIGNSLGSQAPVINPRQIQFAVKFDF